MSTSLILNPLLFVWPLWLTLTCCFCGNFHSAEDTIPHTTIWYNPHRGSRVCGYLSTNTPIFLPDKKNQHVCQALRDQALMGYKIKEGVSHRHAGAMFLHPRLRRHICTKEPFFSSEIENCFTQIALFLEKDKTTQKAWSLKLKHIKGLYTPCKMLQ